MSSSSAAAVQRTGAVERHYLRLRRLWCACPRDATAPTFDTWYATDGQRFQHRSSHAIQAYLCTRFGGTVPSSRWTSAVRIRHPPGASLQALKHQREHPSVRPEPLASFAPLGRAAVETRPWWRACALNTPPVFSPAAAVVHDDGDDGDGDGDGDDDTVTGPYVDDHGTPITCGSFVRWGRRLYVAATCVATPDGTALCVVTPTSPYDEGFHDVTMETDEDDEEAPHQLVVDGRHVVGTVVDGDTAL